METIRTQWASQTELRTVTTTQRDGETWATALQRHVAAVAEARQLFPPRTFVDSSKAATFLGVPIGGGDAKAAEQ